MSDVEIFQDQFQFWILPSKFQKYLRYHPVKATGLGEADLDIAGDTPAVQVSSLQPGGEQKTRFTSKCDASLRKRHSDLAAPQRRSTAMPPLMLVANKPAGRRRIGPHGHIINRVDIRCSNEKEARRLAKIAVDGHPVELWQAERFIVRFEPEH